MSDPVVIVPYDPEWPKRFARLGMDLRTAVDGRAIVAEGKVVV